MKLPSADDSVSYGEAGSETVSSSAAWRTRASTRRRRARVAGREREKFWRRVMAFENGAFTTSRASIPLLASSLCERWPECRRTCCRSPFGWWSSWAVGARVDRGGPVHRANVFPPPKPFSAALEAIARRWRRLMRGRSSPSLVATATSGISVRANAPHHGITTVRPLATAKCPIRRLRCRRLLDRERAVSSWDAVLGRPQRAGLWTWEPTAMRKYRIVGSDVTQYSVYSF